MVVVGFTDLLHVPLPIPVTVPPLLLRANVHAPLAVMVPDIVPLPPMQMVVEVPVIVATGFKVTLTGELVFLQFVEVLVTRCV